MSISVYPVLKQQLITEKSSLAAATRRIKARLAILRYVKLYSSAALYVSVFTVVLAFYSFGRLVLQITERSIECSLVISAMGNMLDANCYRP